MALIDGKIITLSKDKPCVEAVAVKDGRVIKVGSTEEISLLIGKETEILYLDWRTVMPGFIDTHIHLADFGRFLMWIDLANVGSISQMQVLLSQRIQKTSADKWIVGRGWSESRFVEKRLPTRFDLDMVAPEHPVIFYHQAGPIAIANSKALELACITKDTNAPLGGIIDKDPATGEPTGVLRGSAMDLVWKLVPESGIDELVDSAALACEKIMQSGITSIHWLAESSADVIIFKKLLETGKLPLRVYMVIPASLLGDKGLIEGLQSGDSRIGAVEVAADGYLASKTAALSKAYCEDEQNKGKLLLKQQELGTVAENIVKKGYQLIVHAMGDKAIDSALNAIEPIANEKSRCRIDPAALLNKNLIARIKKHKVIVSVQPLVAASEFSVYDAVEHLGEDRARLLYPLKTLFNEGIRVCAGSDCPMEPLNPLLSIQSAATRRFFPEEQLTVHEALCMYTVNAAYATCEEKTKGSIEEGKYADFTVLSGNPEETPISKLHEISVEMTIIGGKITYTN